MVGVGYHYRNYHATLPEYKATIYFYNGSAGAIKANTTITPNVGSQEMPLYAIYPDNTLNIPILDSISPIIFSSGKETMDYGTVQGDFNNSYSVKTNLNHTFTLSYLETKRTIIQTLTFL